MSEARGWKYARSHVLISSNESRREKLQQIAKKELDDLERWKKEHRPGPIKLVPQRLGKSQLMKLADKTQFESFISTEHDEDTAEGKWNDLEELYRQKWDKINFD